MRGSSISGRSCPKIGRWSIWVRRLTHQIQSHVIQFIGYPGHCWSDETLQPALNANDNSTFGGKAMRIHPSTSPSCTHAYVLTRAGARRLLVHLRYPPFAYSRAFDLAVSWLIQSGRLKSFSIVPSIVVQRKIDSSDIMPGKGSDWKDELVSGVLSHPLPR